MTHEFRTKVAAGDPLGGISIPRLYEGLPASTRDLIVKAAAAAVPSLRRLLI